MRKASQYIARFAVAAALFFSIIILWVAFSGCADTIVSPEVDTCVFWDGLERCESGIVRVHASCTYEHEYIFCPDTTYRDPRFYEQATCYEVQVTQYPIIVGSDTTWATGTRRVEVACPPAALPGDLLQTTK